MTASRLTRLLALAALVVFLGAAAAPAPAGSTALAATTASAPAPEQQEAERLLGLLQHDYRYLDDVTVTFGTPSGGAQASSYYTLGRIVIDPAHEAALSEVLVHEAWHIIDWRDNGRIDWGENVPPADRSGYLR